MPVIARQPRLGLRRSPPAAAPTRSAPRGSARRPPRRGCRGSVTIGSSSSSRACRSSPVLPRSASSLPHPVLGRAESRAETAWSNSCTTSSSTSVADCASTVSRIGYRRCGSRRSSACRSGGGPSWPGTGAARRAAPTDPGCPRPGRAGTPACRPRPSPRDADASTGPVDSHRNRDIPIDGSMTSNPSSSAHRCRGELVRQPVVGLRPAPARGRARPARTSVTGPGRITRAEIRYSHASRNNNVGESCSIARASRNSSSSFSSIAPAARQPRYCAASRRCSVRVCARCPYERICAASTLSCSGQPRHRHRRRRGHLVRHEPQPRQRTQLHRQPQPISRAAAPARGQERHIGRGQREEPEQLLTADLREPPQTLPTPRPRTPASPRNPTSSTPTNLIGSQAKHQHPAPQPEPEKTLPTSPYV